ncbi:hypothetical protein [Bradyrhizobium sp. sBnM-33]|uniref:hypothetical protein n=1 Tax=Bradyrhizobium sp. sBnM-33 TaxID=2831780 RepID=UPI001BCD6A9A|nr:hypothetical protein [Bradyrhizobium sp. sBnM-33]WOH46979.1 hypothetical protein RX328_22460 [Bradyrhizobium sp. sBnM-33]
MSMNVAIDRRKEVVRLGSGEAKAVELVLQATNFSKQYGSVTGILYYGGGLEDGNGTV